MEPLETKIPQSQNNSQKSEAKTDKRLQSQEHLEKGQTAHLYFSPYERGVVRKNIPNNH